MTNKVYKVYIDPYTGQNELVVAKNYSEMERKVRAWILKQNKQNEVDHWNEISDVQMLGEITIE